MSRQRLLSAIVAGSLLGIVLAAPVSAVGSAHGGQVLPPDARPHGKSYARWSADWWRWALSIPTATNPVLSNGQVDCSQGNSGRVWFLAGNPGGTSVRSCDIPTGTALFFPITNLVAWRPGDFTTEEEGRALLGSLMNDAVLEATVDGRPVRRLHDFRVQSPLFRLTLPADNIFGITDPLTRDFISDGFWLFLRPLPVGRHVIHFAASYDFFGTTSALDVTYEITVVPRSG